MTPRSRRGSGRIRRPRGRGARTQPRSRSYDDIQVLVKADVMKNSCSTQAFSRLAIFLVVCGIAGSPAQLYAQRTTGMLLTSTVSVTEQDPNKPASELNHHLAGYALIAIGALVIAGYSSEKLRPLQLVWPFLFVAAGLFLAAWSDAEIWPRGNLSWRFLIPSRPGGTPAQNLCPLADTDRNY